MTRQRHQGQEEVAKPTKPKRQGPYTDVELRAVFTMARLLLLLDGIEQAPKMNKRAMLRVLMAGPCPTRSRGSLEAKLMNVSGASERIGEPIIPGYKAAPNCQRVMIEIARTTFIENSDEYLDVAVYIALMESQSKALQDAAFQPGLLGVADVWNALRGGQEPPVESMTEAQWRKRCEDSFMAKYSISRTRARREYAQIIDRDVASPPKWVALGVAT